FSSTRSSPFTFEPLLVAVKSNVSTWPAWMTWSPPTAEPFSTNDGAAAARRAGTCAALVSTVTREPAISTEPRTRASRRTFFGRVVMADGNSARGRGPGPNSPQHASGRVSIRGGRVRVAGERAPTPGGTRDEAVPDQRLPARRAAPAAGETGQD